jgi:ornithine carbamoyltransferase
VSFEAAVVDLGANPISLQGSEMQLGRGETIEDTGRALSAYVDAIVVRTHDHQRLEQLADAASVPVVNALTDRAHPCQTLADLQTIEERFGGLEGVRVTFVGDGNNVARSLMFGCALGGARFTLGSPRRLQPSEQDIRRAKAIASSNGGDVDVTEDPTEAVRDAQVVYTDAWTSMGQESERDLRLTLLEPYRLDAAKVSLASSDAIVMHCLPAHRGEEIDGDVLDGPRSVVWQQAGNRLHAQKSLLAWLVSPRTADAPHEMRVGSVS